MNESGELGDLNPCCNKFDIHRHTLFKRVRNNKIEN